jgi:hypothetical protein
VSAAKRVAAEERWYVAPAVSKPPALIEAVLAVLREVDGARDEIGERLVG